MRDKEQTRGKQFPATGPRDNVRRTWRTMSLQDGRLLLSGGTAFPPSVSLSETKQGTGQAWRLAPDGAQCLPHYKTENQNQSIEAIASLRLMLNVRDASHCLAAAGARNAPPDQPIEPASLEDLRRQACSSHQASGSSRTFGRN
jgi:hypothetical protein